MTLTPSQVKTFRDGLQAVADKKPQIDWLRRVATVAPEFAERIQEVVDMSDHHELLCTTALAAAGV